MIINKIQNNGDSTQQSSFWLGLIIPYLYRQTYSFIERGSTLESKQNVMAEDGHIIIDDDCVSWSVSESKSSHTGSLSMRLLGGDFPYLDKVLVDDWIIFWVFNSKTEYLKAKGKIKNKNFQDLNTRNSGLKFIGKVASLVKSFSRSPENGAISSGYELNAKSFQELDQNIYFDLTGGYLKNNFVWPRQEDINSAYPTPTAIVTTQQAIQDIYGWGFSIGSARIRNINEFYSQAVSISRNETILIPETIGKILDRPEPYEYLNFFKLFIGAQNYQTSYAGDFNAPIRGVYNSKMEIKDPHQLLGLYTIGGSLWSLMSRYLNYPVNEMYTCLRLDENDRISPTLICRRTPLSSSASFIKEAIYAQEYVSALRTFDYSSLNIGQGVLKDSTQEVVESFGITEFSSLPAWEIPIEMVYSCIHGRNSAMRKNYVLWNCTNHEIKAEFVHQFKKESYDEVSIKRNGLFTEESSLTGNFIADQIDKTQGIANFYNYIGADIVMNQHLKLTGSIRAVGIIEPICIGDNCIFDNMLYHIDTIGHSGSIDGSGRKSFETSLGLINGIKMSEIDLQQPDYLSPLDRSSSSTTERGN